MLFRVGMNVFSIGLATAISFYSRWPLIGKIIVWPISWFIFTGIYIWMASIALLPRLILFQKEKDPGDFQRLGLG
jgi:hypothetical protein